MRLSSFQELCNRQVTYNVKVINVYEATDSGIENAV